MRVVFLHAFPLDRRMWEGQAGAHAPDLYGRGATIDEWAASVLAEVDERDLALVGASMGGYCALAAARRAPERVRALVLAGARADADSRERRAGRDATIDLVEREGVAGLWHEMEPKLFAGGAPAEVVARARAIALEQDPRALVGALGAMRDRPDSFDVLRSLAAPVLVVAGEHDPFLPPDDARAVAAAATAGRLEIVDGAGHLPSLEQPERFDRLVSDFLAPLR